MSEERLLSTGDLAKRLDVSRQAIYLWRKQGLPTEIIFNRTIRYDWNVVVEWLNSKGKESKVG
tara:strand:+ start:337 stop:525 length:189 start_codon:yes stop_codon:yes gene_type:complete